MLQGIGRVEFKRNVGLSLGHWQLIEKRKPRKIITSKLGHTVAQPLRYFAHILYFCIYSLHERGVWCVCVSLAACLPSREICCEKCLVVRHPDHRTCFPIISDTVRTCETSGFRRGVVETLVLLGCYAVYVGSNMRVDRRPNTIVSAARLWRRSNTGVT